MLFWLKKKKSITSVFFIWHFIQKRWISKLLSWFNVKSFVVTTYAQRKFILFIGFQNKLEYFKFSRQIKQNR